MMPLTNCNKEISLQIDTMLYSAIENFAKENGEELSEFVSRLLSDAVSNWADYTKGLEIANDNTRERIFM
ncbi:MAG: hypothetical protein MJ247_02945 [Alphaproteobacteria bacterium]|nr:hypothetical protein [Alphaproteobacteria bacterium]